MIHNLRLLLFVLVLTNSTCLLAQDYSFKDYDWEEKNTKISVPEQYKNENEVILERNTKVELAVEGGQAKQYYLLHEKIFINSDDAIERNNKIYIPFNLDESVLTNKVRVILKSGKVIKLDKKDVKEETDEERSVKYNYFAINGLEKGAVIEKLFVLEENPELNGKSFRMQSEYPIASNTFELIYPTHLHFKTKSYNGLAEATIDEQKIKDKKVIYLADNNIPGLNDDEKYSNWDNNIRLFRYKLDANTASGGRNLYNYKEFATNFYERMNPQYDGKQTKVIAEFANTITKSDNLQEQVWNIENKIKKTIAYNRYIDSKETLSEIIKTKQANHSDLVRLYQAIFKSFNIENSMVFTSNRYGLPFDAEFESYENLSSMLFYFPALKMYLSPTDVEYRLPLFPANLANNNGLFIKGKSFGGVTMGIGEVNFIQIPGSEITHDEMDITIDFTKDIENPIIRNKISFGGYAAMNFQPIKDFASAEQYQTVLKSVAENYTVETEYKTLTSGNDGTDYIGKKPFILDVTFEGKDLIQKAGANYLFSIGQTIGRQMELYQENKRVLPVEIDYPHSYLRKIKIIVPEGVTVKNLDKLVMDLKTQLNGKTEAAFTSNYTQKGNEIMIENVEYYHVVNYPLSSFESYRAVINAAADFNKAVIILSK